MTKGYQEFPTSEPFVSSHPKLLSNDKNALTSNADATPPLNPKNGMKWYDTTNKVLKMYREDTKAWHEIPLKDANGTLQIDGTVYTKNNTTIRRKGSDGFLQLGMEALANGARLNLFGKDCEGGGAGGFDLATGDGQNANHLIGATNGALTWRGKNIARSVNGFASNLNGDVIVPNYEQDGAKIVGSPDYNTLVDPGFYHCYSSGAQNGPGFPTKMLVFANKSSSGHTTQVAFPIYTETDKDSPCYRSKNENGTWEKWRTLVDDDDLRAIGLWRFSKGDTGIDDCNAVDLTKFNVGWTRSTTLNAPVKNWCAIITQPGDANNLGTGVGQLAFGIQTGAVFHRNCVSNKWSEWKELAFLDNSKDVSAKTITSNTGYMRLTMPTVEDGVAPPTTQYSYIGVYDKNGFTGTSKNRIAFVQHAVRNDGSVDTGLFSVKPGTSGATITHLSCGWLPDGTRCARTNAVPSDDADGAFDIATVHWTRMHGGGAFGIGEKAPSVSNRADVNDMNVVNKTGFYSISGTENSSPGGKTTVAMHIERAWEAGVNAAQFSWGVGSRVFTRTRTQSEGWQAWNELLPVKSRSAIISGNFHNAHNASVVKGTNPSKVCWTYFGIHDSTDVETETGRLAMFAHRHDTTGEVRTRMACYKPTANSNEAVTIDVGYWADGSPFTYAPTPSENSNNNCIATTQWTRALLKNSLNSYLPLSGGVISGTLKAKSFQATSDSRLKEEQKDVLYDLSSLKPKHYKFKGDNEFHVGLIAQDVEKVIPEAVGTDENGYKSLDYNAIVAALVGEVNALKEEVARLKEAIG